jgi:hypothetical protein
VRLSVTESVSPDAAAPSPLAWSWVSCFVAIVTSSLDCL